MAASMPEPNFQVMSFSQQDGVKARKYQKRKTHAKSKTGCATCKVKRIKCDETRPACYRCLRTQTPCVYAADATTSTSTASALQTKHKLPLECLEMPLCALPDTITKPSTPYGTPRIILLKHFGTVFAALHSFGADSDPGSIINLGLSHPHLLDAILAVSASHLRLHAPSPAKHRVAEHFQQKLAVKRLRTALEEPLDQNSSDALLLSSMMLNLLAFSIVDPEAEVKDSWVFSEEPERLSWFSLQLGYKPLLQATRAYHGRGTMLSWMFSSSDTPSRAYNGAPRALLDVPPHWLALCGLNREDDTDVNLFHEPIRILSMIKDLPPLPENYFLYLAFIGRLDFDFRNLLEEGDHRALWTLGFWLGLMSRFGFWWMSARTKLDHQAVVVWFERRIKDNECGKEAMWKALMKDLKAAPEWSEEQYIGSHVVEV